MVHFAKNSNFDFLNFLAKRRKSIEKMIHQKKKIGVTEQPRSLNPDKVIAAAICPIIVHFRTERACSMHDLGCEFACVVRMCRNN